MKHVTTFFPVPSYSEKVTDRSAYTDQYQIHPCFEDKDGCYGGNQAWHAGKSY